MTYASDLPSSASSKENGPASRQSRRVSLAARCSSRLGRASAAAFTLGACAALVGLVGVGLAGCSDEAGASTKPGSDAGTSIEGGPSFTGGEELRVPVPAGARVHVKLSSPAAIVTPADPKTSTDWDIAFEGADVFTNSGPSGSGRGAAFGPLEGIVFLDDATPDVPFLYEDKPGGAFIRWYFYEGAPNHALHSRFHVFGIKDGSRLFKVQVLTYYGRRDGAAISGLYKIRYAEVGVGGVQEAVDLDGTGMNATDANECIDLGTGARVKHTATEAQGANDWHLCFRRQDISVNGGIGGPRNVGAIDFDGAATASETLMGVVERTAESELARFDAVNAQSFAGQDLRGDGVVSAFTGLWTERGVSPIKPAGYAWRVQGAGADANYLVGFASFDGATATGPGTVVLRVKKTSP